MVSTAAAPAAPSRFAVRRLALRRLLARQPQIWLYGVAVAAGMAVVALTAYHQADERPGAGGAGWPGPSPLTEAWGGWMAMVVAMMLPVVAPQARHMAVRSLRRRRHRAMAGFLAGYLAVWALIGAAIVVVLHGAGLAHPPAGLAVAALFGAALWQVAEPRRRVLRRCGALRLGAPKGFAADRACAAAGWRTGLLCAFTCGPVMVATAAAHHQPALMGAVLALLLTERAPGPNPERRAGRPFEAWALMGLAAAVALVAAI